MKFKVEKEDPDPILLPSFWTPKFDIPPILLSFDPSP